MVGCGFAGLTAPIRQATRMIRAVTETMIVEMALISGVTPKRMRE